MENQEQEQEQEVGTWGSNREIFCRSTRAGSWDPALRLRPHAACKTSQKQLQKHVFHKHGSCEMVPRRIPLTQAKSSPDALKYATVGASMEGAKLETDADIGTFLPLAPACVSSLSLTDYARSGIRMEHANMETIANLCMAPAPVKNDRYPIFPPVPSFSHRLFRQERSQLVPWVSGGMVCGKVAVMAIQFGPASAIGGEVGACLSEIQRFSVRKTQSAGNAE